MNCHVRSVEYSRADRSGNEFSGNNQANKVMKQKPKLLLVALLAAVGVAQAESLQDKTLVAWVTPSNLTQRGGSVLTIDDGKKHFDGIVFGEVTPAKWMAGSDYWKRTEKNQDAWPAETVPSPVQIAIVYHGNEVTTYRDGKEYSRHTIKEPLTFGPGSVIVIGPRHPGSKDCFAGAVDDARIYDGALTAEQIVALKPNEPSDPEPWAWWTFDDAKDRTGRFSASQTVSGAKLENGRLVLDGKKAGVYSAHSSEALSGFIPWALPPSLAAKPNIPEDIAIARRLRNHLLSDPYRPAYHFVIPEDYASPFDPNGAIFWRGQYHLFYIYQENQVHCFGHVSSVDMVHWRQHPTPLFPTVDSPDRGMFSGNCFINKHGEATMIFHGVGAGNCIATSTDDNLDHWTKLPSNPVIPNPTASEPYASWDPFGWVEGDTYYAIFGGKPGKNPAIPSTVFKATELDGWHYVGPFLHHDMPDVAPNEDISCANFFKLGGKRVLVCIAHNRGTRYYVGEWKNEQFYPEVHERMSWVDNAFFAPRTLEAPDGRQILWNWIFDQRDGKTRGASGWSGEMSLPRELSLGGDNRLRMRPIEELKRLRYNEQSMRNIAIPAGKEIVLDKITGNTIELEFQIDPQDAKQVGIKVCRSPGGEEETPVFYDVTEQQLKIDTTKSSLGQGPKKVEAGPLALKPGELLTLRVFVDRSIVEAFANDRQAAMRRIYPSRPDSLTVSVFSNGGAAKVKEIKAWQIAPSNPY